MSAWFDRAINEIGTETPDETGIADLRGLLYGLHAILKLHTVQEDETYLSLSDDADALPQGNLRRAHPRR